jgi:hypothetical protein
MRLKRLGRNGTPRGAAGAAAVEFAVILPLLVLIVGGTLDFGVRFFELQSLEDGIRDAARTAAVGDTGDDSSCTVSGSSPPNVQTHELVCLVKDRVGLDPSHLRVKIAFGSAGGNEGEPVLICAQYLEGWTTGLLPESLLPLSYARSIYRLEKSVSYLPFEESSATRSWSWCAV